MASLRHRRGIGAAAKGYDDYIPDDGSGTAPDIDTATEEDDEEEDRRRLHLGLHSMTAKVSSVPPC
jgi:hypothetical protein